MNAKKAEILELNCGSDSFDELYPFNIDSIKVAYLEKIYSLMPSKIAVFEKSFFEERYVVTFNDGTIKRYKVDPVHRDFRLVNE